MPKVDTDPYCEHGWDDDDPAIQDDLDDDDPAIQDDLDEVELQLIHRDLIRELRPKFEN